MRTLIGQLGPAIAYHLGAPRFLIVMGMHRSGTSYVARVLNLMGASLGPVDEGVKPPGSDEMHFESGELNWINEEILRRSGGSWQTPPTTVRATAHDRWRCRQFLWQFARVETAVVKDPRMMLTYSVWRPLLPPHRIVACIRHPLDVARSLARRDGLTLEQGVRLWATYNERFLEQLGPSQPVIWVDFDQGRASIQPLVRNLAGTWGLNDTATARSCYDRDVHHHRASGDPPADVAELHKSLRARASLPSEQRR